MQIALVTSWPTEVGDGSGTAVFFNALVDGLRASNHSVEVIAPNYDISNYVEVTLRRFLFNTDLRTDPRVLGADLVIGFDYDGYGLDPATRPPMLTSVHAVYGDVVQWEIDPVRTMVEAQAFFDRVAMERSDHITIGSQYAKDRVVELYDIAPEKITVIPHGLREPAWLAQANTPLAIPNDHPIIFALGKMYPRKRFGLLLQALALLKTDYPSVELRIAGDGLEWDQLHVLADELGVNANVTWLSWLSPTGDSLAFAREWQQADIFCHPSYQETFGFVYLEAMLLGKPIVAVRAGAAPEVLGNAALLVEPENPAALANALASFLQDSALRERYSRLARERAAQYSHEKMIDGHIKVIEQLIGSTNSAKRSVNSVIGT
ncbi:MAG: glycosyltransferase family 4 protein [Chloroflexota bacterium]